MKHSDGFDEGLIKVFGRRALPRSRGGWHAYPCRMSHLVSRRVLVMGLLGVGTVTLVSGCGAESNSSSSAGSTQPAPPPALPEKARKRVVEGKSVSVSVDLGGRRIIKKKKMQQSLN